MDDAITQFYTYAQTIFPREGLGSVYESYTVFRCEKTFGINTARRKVFNPPVCRKNFASHRN